MPPTRPADQSFADIVQARYSCRAFRADPLPESSLRQILRLAQTAASWCNVQPWHLIMLSGPRLDALRMALTAEPPQAEGDLAPPAAYDGVYRDRRRGAGLQLYGALGIGREDHAAKSKQAARNFQLFDAPHLAILCSERSIGPYGILDCGGFLAQFMLAAQSIGVASIAQGAIARQSAVLRQHLPIPDTLDILCGISLGYAAEDPANNFRTARAPLDEFVTWID